MRKPPKEAPGFSRGEHVTHATIDDLSTHILRLHSLVGRYAVHEATMVARGERFAGDYTLYFFTEWLGDQDEKDEEA